MPRAASRGEVLTGAQAGTAGAGSRWQIWVDTGGTFTDCVALDPAGGLHRAKVLSSSCLRGRAGAAPQGLRLEVHGEWVVPAGFFAGARLAPLGSGREVAIVGSSDGGRSLDLEAAPPGLEAGAGVEIRFADEAPVLAARLVTGTSAGAALPPLEMRLATTRGTNALLERRGAATALFTTRGLGDLLEIGDQRRPDLFALEVRKRAPLHAAVVEVEERLAADGEVLVPLDPETVRPLAERLLARGVRTAAVALLHSYRDPDHEDRLAALLEELGFRHVSRSASLAPRIRILHRAETAVVNAYLSEAVESYFRRVGDALAEGSLRAMTSAGSLMRAAAFQPKDSLLSGPAGGVVGAAWAGLRSGFGRTLAFDMGGTSTDVSRFDGDYDYVFETRVGDARLLAPSLAIATVAAGGGSICSFDGRQLKVGPESAGALPGPACYGAGGPLTLTDVNLLLGRLAPERFEIPLDPAAARRACDSLLQEVREEGAGDPGREEILSGLLEIANERMAEAVRQVSIRHGYRPADYALVAFGGAGAQHACALAEILGLETVLVPADAGLLSAVGLGRARIERFAERQILEPLAAVGPGLEGLARELAEEPGQELVGEGVPAAEIEVRRRIAHLRLVGQEATLEVELGTGESLEQAFLAAYGDHYGYLPEEPSIEVESLRVVVGQRESRSLAPPQTPEGEPAAQVDRRLAWFGGAWMRVPVFAREELRPGSRFAGPALVFERHSATVVDPGWKGEVDGAGCLVLRLATGEDTA